MKVLLLGAGGQGGPCASIMARDDEITKVIMADANLEFAKKVASKVNSEKIEIKELDASNIDDVAELAKDMDIIIDLTPVWLGPTVMQAAVKAKTNYISTSFDVPYLDQWANYEPLFLEDEIKEAGITTLLGCGLAPGFINIMARHFCDNFDTIDSVKYRFGKKKLNQPEFAEITEPWNPGWSPKQALIDFSNPCYVFQNGKFESLEPFSGIEDFPFPDPVGNVLVSHHTHEEVVSTPRAIGKGIQYCDFKYYVAKQAAYFYAMGMTSQEEINFNGSKIRPIDFIVHFVPEPGGAFLNEKKEDLDAIDKGSSYSMVIIIEGTENGKKVRYTVKCPKLTGNAVKLYDLFGTSQIGIALPVVIGAKIVNKGVEKGIMLPEQIDSNAFLDLFLSTGIPYKWDYDKEEL